MTFDDMRARLICNRYAPDVVKSVEVVNGFVSEWQNNPWMWFQEIDVHVELAARLRNAFDGEHIQATHHHHRRGEEPVRFHRVACTPYVKMSGFGSGEWDAYCHPDIVLWDTCGGEGIALDSGMYPIAFCAEVKLKTYTREIVAEGNGSMDAIKLKQLLGHDWCKVACCVSLLGYPAGDAYPSDCPSWPARLEEMWSMQDVGDGRLLVECRSRPRQWLTEEMTR